MQTQTIYPSSHLFKPENKTLICPSSRLRDSIKTREVSQSIENLFSKSSYPCIAALKSYNEDEYMVGIYEDLGQGTLWKNLRNDLLYFLQEQQKSSSVYLSFWAVFNEHSFTEDEFEKAFWKELSYLTSKEDIDQDWKNSPNFNPSKKEFTFCIDGHEFFVVGLHPNSSREARRFPYPTMIFNVFSQFDELQRRGVYNSMVQVNRKRDLKLQGSVNPMAEKHGEKWESIQFTGKNNSANWKCPFHFFKRDQKP